MIHVEKAALEGQFSIRKYGCNWNVKTPLHNLNTRVLVICALIMLLELSSCILRGVKFQTQIGCVKLKY